MWKVGKNPKVRFKVGKNPKVQFNTQFNVSKLSDNHSRSKLVKFPLEVQFNPTLNVKKKWYAILKFAPLPSKKWAGKAQFRGAFAQIGQDLVDYSVIRECSSTHIYIYGCTDNILTKPYPFSRWKNRWFLLSLSFSFSSFFLVLS